MKPFLILQVRPNKAGDYEYKAFCQYGGLKEEETHRIEMTLTSIAGLNLDDYSGVIVGGGSPCVSEEEKDEIQIRFESELGDLFKQIIEQDKPYLGACYGFGVFADYCGGKVVQDPNYSEEVKAVDITLTEAAQTDPMTQDLPETFRAFVGHKESCVKLPENAVLLASSKKCPNHMFRLKNNIYATQFHPELDVENLLVRIEVYKYAGYFEPGEAEELSEMAKKEDVTIPMIILKRFVDRYRSE
jgi:GMP synthase (glutamine-hydrolysing)